MYRRRQGASCLDRMEHTAAIEGIHMTMLATARLRLEPFADSHLAGLQRMNDEPYGCGE